MDSIATLIIAINNWKVVTCQTLTRGLDEDVNFFTQMVQSLITTLSDKQVGGIGKITSIDAIVDYVSKLFEKYTLLLRSREYNNPVVTVDLQMMFPVEIAKLFNFDQTRNFAEASFIDRTKTQINLQFPINKSSDTLEAERLAGKRPFDDKPGDRDRSPGPNAEKNRLKRLRKQENKIALGLDKTKSPDKDWKPSNVPSARVCINNFADQLKVSNGFANGVPEDAGVRACKPINGVCKFKHIVVDHSPGTLDKGTADVLIKAAENFGNASFKSNFIRILKFLKAT